MNIQTQHAERLRGNDAPDDRARRARGHAGRRRATIVVRADDDLQAALDRARPGDTLLLEAGATYTGNFVLPDKGRDASDLDPLGGR